MTGTAGSSRRDNEYGAPGSSESANAPTGRMSGGSAQRVARPTTSSSSGSIGPRAQRTAQRTPQSGSGPGRASRESERQNEPMTSRFSSSSSGTNSSYLHPSSDAESRPRTAVLYSGDTRPPYTEGLPSYQQVSRRDWDQSQKDVLEVAERARLARGRAAQPGGAGRTRDSSQIQNLRAWGQKKMQNEKEPEK